MLINSLVYASEGLRATLAPQFQHLAVVAVIAALLVFDFLLLAVGLRHKKAISQSDGVGRAPSSAKPERRVMI